jgi:hypothetical protein
MYNIVSVTDLPKSFRVTKILIGDIIETFSLRYEYVPATRRKFSGLGIKRR